MIQIKYSRSFFRSLVLFFSIYFMSQKSLLKHMKGFFYCCRAQLSDSNGIENASKWDRNLRFRIDYKKTDWIVRWSSLECQSTVSCQINVWKYTSSVLYPNRVQCVRPEVMDAFMQFQCSWQHCYSKCDSLPIALLHIYRRAWNGDSFESVRFAM